MKSKAKEYRDGVKRGLLKVGNDDKFANVIVKAIDQSNHKTLEGVEDKVNKHVEYQIGSTKFIALKNLKGILKSLKL